MSARGLLITFEGGDGAGKSTLIEGLYALLKERGESLLKTRAPGGTAVGNKIRSLLLEEKVPLNHRCELFLFLADRAQHMEEILFPALASGTIVLCDRFNDSTIAYQGLGRGLDTEKVEQLCLFATENRKPDLTFYLDIPPELGLSRTLHKNGETDRIESESLAFHEKIRQAFLQRARNEPQRIRVLNATKSPETLIQEAIQYIDDLFLSFR